FHVREDRPSTRSSGLVGASDETRQYEVAEKRRQEESREGGGGETRWRWIRRSTTGTDTLAGNRDDDDDDGSGVVGGGGSDDDDVGDGRDGDDVVAGGGIDGSDRLKFVRLPTRDSYGAGRTVAPLHGKTLKPGRWNARVTTPPPSSSPPLLSSTTRTRNALRRGMVRTVYQVSEVSVTSTA
ncbi:hypothetical protein V1478_018359, partial [Vespula squamosa]